MKYFEFETKKFEYYALIAAKNLEDAVKCYNENVCELSESDYKGKIPEPEEITKETVLEHLTEVCTLDEINSFERDIKSLDNDTYSKADSMLVLIDGGLI